MFYVAVLTVHFTLVTRGLLKNKQRSESKKGSMNYTEFHREKKEIHKGNSSVSLSGTSVSLRAMLLSSWNQRV